MKVLIYAAAAGLIALMTYLMVVGQPILLPFVIAVFVSYLINAVATITGRISIAGRTLPRGLGFAAAIVVLLVASWLMVNLVVVNIGQVVAAAPSPSYEQNLRKVTGQLAEWIGVSAMSQIELFFQGVRLTDVVRSLAYSLMGLVGSAGTVAVYVIFCCWSSTASTGRSPRSARTRSAKRSFTGSCGRSAARFRPTSGSRRCSARSWRSRATRS